MGLLLLLFEYSIYTKGRACFWIKVLSKYIYLHYDNKKKKKKKRNKGKSEKERKKLLHKYRYTCLCVTNTHVAGLFPVTMVALRVWD